MLPLIVLPLKTPASLEGKGREGGALGAWGWRGGGNHGVSTEQTGAKNEPKMTSE